MDEREEGLSLFWLLHNGYQVIFDTISERRKTLRSTSLCLLVGAFFIRKTTQKIIDSHSPILPRHKVTIETTFRRHGRMVLGPLKINAVFEGGGVKGIALVGAIHAAERQGFRFHRMAGTSSGAIVACLLAAGYTAEELQKIIMETPMSKLIQPSDWMKIRWIGPPLRLLLYKGLYSGEPLEKWMHELLAAKHIFTFGDLPSGKLRIIASDISEGRLMVLPDDLLKYGLDPAEFPISRAARMSASLPYFFEPVVLRNAMKKANYVVDGGLLSNFPLWLFDQDTDSDHTRADLPHPLIPTVGFQLVGRKAQVRRTIDGPISMFYALFATMLEAHDERYIEETNRFRTIKIPTLGIHTTQFELSDEVSMRLYESGYEAGKKYFDKWSLSAYQKQFDQFCLKVKA